jgi:hypothetical protein
MARNLLDVNDMNPKLCRLAATLLFSVAVPGLAQTTDNPASTPLGRGAGTGDSRPADGAIKGGAILPGESAGMPSERAKSRCADLQGTLREQCLAQERGSSTGGTRLPDPDIARPPQTREAPPPQNPPLR